VGATQISKIQHLFYFIKIWVFFFKNKKLCNLFSNFESIPIVAYVLSQNEGIKIIISFHTSLFNSQ